VLDVTSSGFYAYLKRPLGWRAVVDELLMAHVRIAFAESGETDGAPRVLQELHAAGLPTSQKRVARLMRQEASSPAGSAGRALSRPTLITRIRSRPTCWGGSSM
jgi:hypothetical protein